MEQTAGDRRIAASDPPVWWWTIGMSGWLVTAYVLASSSGWSPVASAAMTGVGVALGSIAWGPRRMTLSGHQLSKRTIWRRTEFDLRTTVGATWGELSKFSPGELYLRFSDGSTWDITLRGRQNVRFAEEVVATLDRLGKSEVVERSARTLT